MAKYLTAALYALIACSVISVVTSYATYQYRSHLSGGTTGELSYYGGSDTFITPNDVFEPQVSVDVQTDKTSSGTAVDYLAMLKNIILIFIPLGAAAILKAYAEERSAKNRGAITAAAVSGLIFFVLGSALAYAFYLPALKQQQSYADSLYAQNTRLKLELNQK